MINNKEMKQMLETIAKAMDSKHAQNIEIFDLSKISSLADYFVICTGSSDTNVKAISDNVETELEEKMNILPQHIEGHREANWILLDYGSILVHVFLGETRRYYSIERLWNETAKIDVEQFIAKEAVTDTKTE